MKPSISVFIPAYNEAGNIETVVQTIREKLAGNSFTDYEIIIVDDRSTDGTGKIIDEMAKADPHVRPVHNERNRGIGYNFQVAAELAKGEFCAYIPGDNEVTAEAIHNMFAAVGPTDIVNTYIVNPKARPFVRQVISRTFIIAMDILFGLRLRYYTGPAIIRTAALRRTRRTTHGFAFIMEILVQLVKAGYSYAEVPMPVQPRKYGRPIQVFRPKDMWRVFKAVCMVLRTVYFSPALKELRAARMGTVA